MKNPFKRKKSPIPKLQSEPRNKTDIQADVDRLFKQIGESEYQVFVHTETLKSLNHKMVGYAREMQARLEFEKANEPKESENAQS